VWVMAIGAGQLPFSERHVGRAHELGPSLQVALAANLSLGSLVEKRSLIVDLGELEAIRGLFHDGVAVDAGDTTARMRACLPVRLHSFLVTLEAGFVLNLGRLPGFLTESDQPPHTLSAPLRHVIATRAMTGLAGLPFKLISSIEEKDLSHHGLGEFLELWGMAGLADLAANGGGLL